MPYSVKVNVLNYERWHFTCDQCDWRSSDKELLSDLVLEMTAHTKEQHPATPKSVGYPAPPKPSLVFGGNRG